MNAASAHEMSPESPVTFWENVGQSSRMGQYITNVESRFLLEAVQMMGNPGSVLEIGCDGGRWTRQLADLGCRITCTDINPAALEICRKRVPQARCILTKKADTTFPVESSSMDLLACIEVPGVIESTWFGAEAARVLKPNGIVLGTTWNTTSLRAQAHRIVKRLKAEKDNRYYSRVPYRALRSALANQGFDLLKEEGLCWPPFSRTSNSPWIPLCGKMERILGLHRLIRYSPWIVFIARRR